MKKISLFLLLSACCCLTASLASPQRGYSAAKNLSFIEDSAPVNLWEWPDAVQQVRKYYRPADIWIPEIGIWYVCAGCAGYIDSNRTTVLLDGYSSNDVSTSFVTGYSAGAFLPILPGNYRISCETDGKAQFRIAFYEEMEGGFKWLSYTILSASSGAGYYERTFTVPDNCSLLLLLPTSSQRNAPPLTVTDIEIYRIN